MIDGYRVIDLHVHSNLSGCADDAPGYTPEVILRRAGQLGIDGVGFADHVLDPAAPLPPEVFAELAPRPGLERIARLRAELAALEAPGLPPFAVGAEVDVFLDGAPAISAAARPLLDHAPFSANHPPLAAEQISEDLSPEDVARNIMKKTRAALRSGMATSLAHPLLPMARSAPQEVFACYRPLGVDGLFEEARDAGVALGFSRHLVTNQQLFRTSDAEALYADAVRVGVKLAFETDSHLLWQQACIVPLVALARRFGLGPECFLTDLPAPAAR
jgi:histidinol phosphatase-like PHP family hydrolase